MHHKRGNIDTIYIYALIDPRNLEVRYIGKTNNPKERYYDHISTKAKYLINPDKRRQWIIELKAINLKPIMSVLTPCPEGESELYEYRYYKLFKDACNLLNAATISKETYQYDIWNQ